MLNIQVLHRNTQIFRIYGGCLLDKHSYEFDDKKSLEVDGRIPCPLQPNNNNNVSRHSHNITTIGSGLDDGKFYNRYDMCSEE